MAMRNLVNLATGKTFNVFFDVKSTKSQPDHVFVTSSEGNRSGIQRTRVDIFEMSVDEAILTLENMSSKCFNDVITSERYDLFCSDIIFGISASNQTFALVANVENLDRIIQTLKPTYRTFIKIGKYPVPNRTNPEFSKYPIIKWDSNLSIYKVFSFIKHMDPKDCVDVTRQAYNGEYVFIIEEPLKINEKALAKPQERIDLIIKKEIVEISHGLIGCLLAHVEGNRVFDTRYRLRTFASFNCANTIKNYLSEHLDPQRLIIEETIKGYELCYDF